MVDCGSYFVVIYRRGKLICKIKERKRKRKELIVKV